MSAPIFAGEPDEALSRAENAERRDQWAMVELWLKTAPEAEVDAWLEAHQEYRGPNTNIRTYHLRRAVRLQERDGADAAAAYLTRAHDAAEARKFTAEAEARLAASAPRAVDRIVDGTFAAILVVPVGAVATLAAYVGGGPHAAAGVATFVTGLGFLHAVVAAAAARRAR